jgi:aspartate/methionine/tyrosine aminotransferase
MNVIPSAYMTWAKAVGQTPATYELTSSGMGPLTWKDLPTEDLPLTLRQFYGTQELREVLGKQYGVDPDQVLTTCGTSEANFLIAATLVSPGDRVVLEEPAYEPIVAMLRSLGADLVRLPRRMEAGFVPDVKELEELVTGAKLVLVTNLHNPTGCIIPHDVLRQLLTTTAAAGSILLVDQVYMDFVPDAPQLEPHENLVITSSLTKVYGLQGIRMGWAVGSLPLIRRAWQLKDLTSLLVPYAIEAIAHRVLSRREEFRATPLIRSRQGLAMLGEWVEKEGLTWVRPAGGLIASVRLPNGVSSWELADHLLAVYQTRVVPGDFFDMPGYLRIGVGGDPALTSAGLERVARGIKDRQVAGVRAR